MMINSIWQRYFIKETLKVFFFFLFTFYFLYAFVDYSTKFQDFAKDASLSTDLALKYYALQFIKRLDLLVPLALMIATIKVLTTLNTRRELVALQAAGTSIHTLLKPFFFVGTCSFLFLLVGQETFMPPVLMAVDEFQMTHFHKMPSQNKGMRIFALEDGSKLFCQGFHYKTHTFEDVIWVVNTNNIWRAKAVKIEGKAPIAYFADHIVRNSEGLLVKENSYPQIALSSLKWSDSLLFNTKKPIDNYKISELISSSYSSQAVSVQEGVDIRISLLSKTTMTLLPLLVILGVAPYCIRYSRQSSYFLLYSLALFCFVAFFTLMDAMVVLAENHVLPPTISMLTPFIALGALFGFKFIKATS